MDSVPVRVKGTQAERVNAGRDEGGSSRGGRQRKKLPLGLNKWLMIGVIVLVLIGALIGTWQWASASQNDTIDTSKYQAVFFTNGQVYFGKLQMLNDNYMKLTNVFYLQTPNSSTNGSSQNPQDANKTSQLQLTKLGTEIHSPEDEMVINRSQVLFFENLKDNGKVVQGIGTYYKDQQNK